MNRSHGLILLAALSIAADAPREEVPARVVEQSLRALNEAYVKKDVAAIKRLTGEDLVVVTSAGKRQSREEQLQALADLEIREYKVEDVQVSMPAKDLAIITCKSLIKGSFKEKELPPKMAVVTIWVNRGGKWLEVFYQGTPLAGK